MIVHLLQIDDAQREFLGFTISSMSVFGISFLLASFIIFLVQEKESKVSLSTRTPDRAVLRLITNVATLEYHNNVFALDAIKSLRVVTV